MRWAPLTPQLTEYYVNTHLQHLYDEFSMPEACLIADTIELMQNHGDIQFDATLVSALAFPLAAAAEVVGVRLWFGVHILRVGPGRGRRDQCDRFDPYLRAAAPVPREGLALEIFCAHSYFTSLRKSCWRCSLLALAC